MEYFKLLEYKGYLIEMTKLSEHEYYAWARPTKYAHIMKSEHDVCDLEKLAEENNIKPLFYDNDGEAIYEDFEWVHIPSDGACFLYEFDTETEEGTLKAIKQLIREEIERVRAVRKEYKQRQIGLAKLEKFRKGVNNEHT